MSRRRTDERVVCAVGGLECGTINARHVLPPLALAALHSVGVGEHRRRAMLWLLLWLLRLERSVTLGRRRLGASGTQSGGSDERCDEQQRAERTRRQSSHRSVRARRSNPSSSRASLCCLLPSNEFDKQIERDR